VLDLLLAPPFGEALLALQVITPAQRPDRLDCASSARLLALQFSPDAEARAGLYGTLRNLSFAQLNHPRRAPLGLFHRTPHTAAVRFPQPLESCDRGKGRAQAVAGRRQARREAEAVPETGVQSRGC
jgi:hypothetical protein